MTAREETGASPDGSVHPDEVPWLLDSRAELRRRVLVSGVVLLVAHLLYTLFQVVSLMLPGFPSFVDADVLRTSIAVNLGLDGVAVVYLAVVRRMGRKEGSEARLRRVHAAFCLIVVGVWGIQAHFGGSQSSHMLALILSTLLVFAWLLPAPQFLRVVVLSVAGLLLLVGLEVAGVLPYSPLLPPAQALRHVYLDWRILAVNASIFACTLAVSLFSMFSIQAASRLGREGLERLVEARTRMLSLQNRELERLREETQARADVLARSEQRFRTVADFTADWEYWRGTDGEFRYVSPACLWVSGHEADEFRADHDLLRRLILDEDRESFLRHEAEEEEARVPGSLRFRLRKKDGSIAWIEHLCRPVFAADGTFIGNRGSNRDVTGHQAAEEALRDERENLRAIFNASPVALLVVDDRTQVVLANQAAARMVDPECQVATEKRPGNLIGCVHGSQHPLGCGHSPDCSLCPLRNALEKVLAGAPGAQVAELALDVARAGAMRRLWLRAGIEPFLLGGRRHVVVALEDVSEARHASELRQQAEAHARQQQKLESLGTLASGVAHEINNPLNVVLNYAQLLMDGMTDPARVREFSSHILHESDRMAGIVRNLLAFARQDREEGVRTRIDEVVERTLSLMRNLFRKDSIHLKVEIPADLPDVLCRPQQVQQVLMNLLTNARDAVNDAPHTGEVGGTIRVSAAVVESEGRRLLRLTVEDNGHGIAPEIAPRVFDPFFSTKPRDKGTGLGLSISYGIAREHGGGLWFEPASPRGTRFHLDLPLPGTEEAGAA